MKQILFLCSMAIIGFCGEAFAQNDAEKAKLHAFLIQESAEPGVKNYQQLGVEDINNVNWNNIGLTWVGNGNYLYRMWWVNKKLAGNLDLSSFERLEYVSCQYNALTTLDVTNCKALKELDCYNNNLNTVDVTTNTKLDYLCVRYNTLKKLDLSNNKLLYFLCSTGNQLDSLDLSGLNKLKEAYCIGNKITYLNVTGCDRLETFSCWGNLITSADFSNLPYLNELTCNKNKLSKLNLAGCSHLITLDCSENKLDTLDLSESAYLLNLNCNNNQLTCLEIDKCVELYEVYCNHNLLDSLKLPESPYLKKIQCMYNNLDFYTLPQLSSSYEEYIYRPQNPKTETAPVDSVDYSYYYSIDGHLSRYAWYIQHAPNVESTVKPVTSNNGVFSFEDIYLNKELICRVENAVYPNLVIRHNVTLTAGTDANEVQESPTVYAGKGHINIVATNTSDMAVYSIKGECVTTGKVSAGHTTIPLQRGAYIVIINNKTSYKLIVS